MNFKLDMSTKLRLENSALGTYELIADENNTYHCQLPKSLSPNLLLGTVINLADTSWFLINVVNVIRVEGNVHGYLLFLTNGVEGEYNPDTGYFAFGFSS